MDRCQQDLREVLGHSAMITYKIKISNLSEDLIIQTVCKVCKIAWSELRDAHSKKHEVIVPRRLIAWLVSYYCSTSQLNISRLLNISDRSAISKDIAFVNDMLHNNDDLYVLPLREVENIILKLTADAE